MTQPEKSAISFYTRNIANEKPVTVDALDAVDAESDVAYDAAADAATKLITANAAPDAASAISDVTSSVNEPRTAKEAAKSVEQKNPPEEVKGTLLGRHQTLLEEETKMGLPAGDHPSRNMERPVQTKLKKKKLLGKDICMNDETLNEVQAESAHFVIMLCNYNIAQHIREKKASRSVDFILSLIRNRWKRKRVL